MDALMKSGAASHRSDPLSPDNSRRGRNPHGGEAHRGGIRFVSVSLVEPDKAALAAHAGGRALARLALIIFLDFDAGATFEATVDLSAGKLAEIVTRTGVQPGIVIEEFILCERAVKADPRWRAALARRGIVDYDKAIVDPWSVGAYGNKKFYSNRRTVQALSYIRDSGEDVGYGRPIEGIMALVDLENFEILEIIEDEPGIPLPPHSGYYTAKTTGPQRADLKPIDIVQPDGASFTVEGRPVRWQKWRFRVEFTPREGLVLHTIGYEDGGRLRSVLHRASMSEMLVPYGDPSLTQRKKNVFDNGEYGIGRMANSLMLGCDCLGVIHYFDAHLSDMAGGRARHHLERRVHARGRFRHAVEA